MKRTILIALGILVLCVPAVWAEQGSGANRDASTGSSGGSSAGSAAGGSSGSSSGGGASAGQAGSSGSGYNAGASGSAGSAGTSGGTAGSSSGGTSAGASGAGGTGSSYRPGQAGQQGQSGQAGQQGQSGQADHGQHYQSQNQNSQQGQQAGQKNIDQKFLTNAYKGNLYEIKLSQMVMQKVQDEKVKQFAQQLIQDHTQANEKVKQVAQAKGVQIQDQQIERWQTELINHLQSKDPQELANEFVLLQVADHHKDILQHKMAAQKCQDPQVKTLAQQMVPKLQQHLQHATRLSEQVTGVRDDSAISGR